MKKKGIVNVQDVISLMPPKLRDEILEMEEELKRLRVKRV